MGLTTSVLPMFKNIAPWDPGTNVHVFYDDGGTHRPSYLWRANNDANAKYLSHPTPNDGQNPLVSTQWDFWWRLDDAGDELYFIIANQPILQIAHADIRGYAVHVDGPNSQIQVDRLDGGGTVVNINNAAWTPDTEYHVARTTREFSGATRLWRLYMGESVEDMAQIGGGAGGTNDATYTDFSHWGWDVLTYNRTVFGGETCQS